MVYSAIPMPLSNPSANWPLVYLKQEISPNLQHASHTSSYLPTPGPSTNNLPRYWPAKSAGNAKDSVTTHGPLHSTKHTCFPTGAYHLWNKKSLNERGPLYFEREGRLAKWFIVGTHCSLAKHWGKGGLSVWKRAPFSIKRPSLDEKKPD